MIRKRIMIFAAVKIFCALFCLTGNAMEDKQLKELTTSTGVKMILIPAGSFLMGDAGGRTDEQPVHKVYLDSFYMDACEVTQKSFEDITGINPSQSRNHEFPVEQVLWANAVLYCNARSLKEGLKPCYRQKNNIWECDFNANGYRLPTEAEWEYASRGGTEGSRFFADGDAQLALFAWYRGNSEKKIHPVGTKKPNAFGLFDMYGNVTEWCNDYYDKEYYSASPEKNPAGPKTGKFRVLRGGSWNTRAAECRSGRRFFAAPVVADTCQDTESNAYGFRCVRKAAKTI